MSGEERIKNKIEFKKNIYIEKKKNKKKQNTGGKGLTLVGGLTPGKARPHMRDGHLDLSCHGHTHTSTALFPFAQANTYRERLSIKGLWGGEKGGLFKAKSVPATGYAGALACSSPRGPALAFWERVAMAGVWRTPNGQDVTNVTFSGTENQSWWRQQQCPVYTV